ncbi:hypothetical protein P4311_17485 [Bacillus thuringiensis]|nr:hypothetical protein [Bacillus thuringiensis]MRB58663.1 hypothetical protein [Bacillus thuringiensis]
MRAKLEKPVEELKLNRSLLMSSACKALDESKEEEYGYYNGQRVFGEQMESKLKQILEEA